MYRNSIVFLLLGLLAWPAAAQVTRTWPGAAPCNTTLQACINGSAAGDIVLIATNAEIDENISLNKSLHLRAAPNRVARFAQGRRIEGTLLAGSGPVQWTVEGLHLRQGSIYLRYAGAAGGSMRVLNSHLVDSVSNVEGALVLLNAGTGVLDVEVSNNRVEIEGGNGVFLSSAGQTTGRIAFNHIHGGTEATSIAHRAVNVLLHSGLDHDFSVVNNRAEWRQQALLGAAMQFRIDSPVGAGGGTPQLRWLGNAVVCSTKGAPGQHEQAGLALISATSSGNHILRAVNNTVIGCGRGIYLNHGGLGGNWTGTVINNLIAHNYFNVLFNNMDPAGFTISHTLSFANGSNTLPASATNTVTADPRLFSRRLPRLTEGSPAINAGNAVLAQVLFAAAGAGQVDADGRRRTIGAGTNAIDIGAFEYGDVMRQPRADGSFAPTGIPDPATRVQASKVFNPGGAAVANPHPIGLLHLSGQWFVENITGSMPANAAFNVFAPGPQGAFGASYLHTVTLANSPSPGLTNLGNSYLNGRSFNQAIVLATPARQAVPHPTGHINVGFGCAPETTSANCWSITSEQTPAQEMLGAGFHVYVQDPSPNAFIHRGTEAARFTAFASHHILGDDMGRCARPVVTPRYALFMPSVAQPVDLESRMVNGRRVWGLYGDSSNFLVGQEFSVFVDAADYERCAFPELFADGFED